jgi:hypothetical protein
MHNINYSVVVVTGLILYMHVLLCFMQLGPVQLCVVVRGGVHLFIHSFFTFK